MKILQVGMGNNPGGVEAFVMNYYRELAEQAEFHFVSMYGEIAYGQEIRRLGGRVFLVPNVKRNPRGYVRKMRALLKKEKYDVVHVNMLSAANLLPLKLAREAGVGMVIAHSHNASAPGLIRNVLHQWNRPRIDRYANVKVACGEKAGRWMFGNQACDQGRVVYLSNAIDMERFLFSPAKRNEIRSCLKLDGCFVIGHVGRFQAQKNHEKILEIFRALVCIEPRARLLLVGGGELEGRIREKVSREGLADRVIFAGVCPNVQDYLSAMDVFLFPSLFEGMPFTLIEAQTAGLPCVISDTITQEAVLDKKNVRILPLAQDGEKWAAALLDCKNTGRAEPSVIRQQLTSAHLNIKQEARRLLQLYRGSVS